MDSLVLPETLDINAVLDIIPPGTLLGDSSGVEKSRPHGEPTQIQECQATEDSGEATENPTNKAAFVLAFFGWDIYEDKSAGLVSCEACFRRLGLWMYKPKDDGQSPIYPTLDVANEHLDYCPWINSTTQSGTGKRTGQSAEAAERHSGWQVLEQVIRNLHRRRTWSAQLETPANQDGPARVSEEADGDEEARKAKDKAWWTKLRRVRQALQVRGPKKGKGAS